MSNTLAHSHFYAFNTANSIAAPTLDANTRQKILDKANYYERLFSRFDTKSQLSAVNAAGGRAMRVDCELATCTQEALRICELTKGCFDISIGSVASLWNFKEGLIVDEAQIKKALKQVDWSVVSVVDDAIRIANPQASLDLGGVAKGWIADHLLALLRQAGLKSAVINLGGNVAVMGGHPSGKAWKIGLRAPFPSHEKQASEAFASVELMEGSVVTSGIYERSFMRDGRLYHHILDPRTGYPAKTDVISASVISKNSLFADALSTACVVMGTKQALDFVSLLDDTEAVIVTADGEICATPHLEKAYQLEICK